MRVVDDIGGIAVEMLTEINGSIPRTERQKQQMTLAASYAYGRFLSALGFAWELDPQSKDTPRRVAKAWVEDLVRGSMSEDPSATTFPNDSGYTGLICQTRISVFSMCAHHNLPFTGVAHVAYIPGKDKKARILGLSKLNRIVDFYARRPNIQESLTKQIHSHVDRLCEKNRGVAVVIEAQHACVSCRGVRDDSMMKTSELSGYFFDNEVGTRTEFFSLIDQSRTR